MLPCAARISPILHRFYNVDLPEMVEGSFQRKYGRDVSRRCMYYFYKSFPGGQHNGTSKDTKDQRSKPLGTHLCSTRIRYQPDLFDSDHTLERPGRKLNEASFTRVNGMSNRVPPL